MTKIDKKEQIVQHLMSRAPALFEKLPRGSLIRSEVEKMAEELLGLTKVKTKKK